MLKRIGVIWIILGSFFYTLPVQASLNGVYGGGGIAGGRQSKAGPLRLLNRDIKDKFWAANIVLGYQQTRYNIFEINIMLSDKSASLRNGFVGVWKKVFPVNPRFNLYFHGGFAYALDSRAKIPFAGVGGTIYTNRRHLVDIAYRCYGIPDSSWWNWSGKETGGRTIHAGSITYGYYFM